MNFILNQQATRLWHLCFFLCLAGSMPTALLAQTEKQQTAPPMLDGASTNGIQHQKVQRNPLLEFIKRIAETDNLYDPELLFSLTMGVANPPKPIVDHGALRSGLQNQPQWPVGISSVSYMLVFPTQQNTPTRRSLDFSLESNLNCIRIEDVAATFGNSLTRMPPPIFTHPVRGDPHTIQIKSQNLFQGNPSSNIQVGFLFNDCATYIYLSNPLDYESYIKPQKVTK